MVKLSVVLLWSGHIQTGKEGGLESGGGSGSVLSVVCVGGSAGPRSLVRVEAGFLLSREDSDGEHLCSEEVSRGFLRPSLEETLASNRSRSVGEEEEVEVVGSCRIRFLLFLFCLPFVFPLSYTLICFYFSFVARVRSSCLDSSFCEWDVTSGPAQGMEAVKTAVWFGLGICIPPWIEGSSGLLDLPWFGYAILGKDCTVTAIVYSVPLSHAWVNPD